VSDRFIWTNPINVGADEQREAAIAFFQAMHQLAVHRFAAFGSSAAPTKAEQSG
jgi:hypothetical protein